MYFITVFIDHIYVSSPLTLLGERINFRRNHFYFMYTSVWIYERWQDEMHILNLPLQHECEFTISYVCHCYRDFR